MLWKVRRGWARSERIDELPDERAGQPRLDPVGLGPLVVGQVIGAEQAVEPGHDRGIVAVDGPGSCVVPVVKGRRRDQIFQRPESPRRLAWMKKPHIVPIRVTTTGTKVPIVTNGPAKPST